MDMNSLTIQTCRACDKILKGRIDKKFCNDHCRNTFNNRLKAETNNYDRNIIHALRKNKMILSGLLGKEESAKVSRSRLLSNGFQFKYHTHTYETKKGGVYTYCFEMGYLALDHDWLLIVRRIDA